MKTSFIFIMLSITIGSYADTPPQYLPPSEPDGEIGGHEYVDLGLPSGTLWATCNLGAETPYEPGQYFAWGEVEPKDFFSWDNYAFYIDTMIDRHNAVWYELEYIGDDISGTQYDAARHIWGNGWRMPNERERYELRMFCWSKWVTENGMNGLRIYGPNENSIFLPACGEGEIEWGGMSLVGISGGYWTSVEDTTVTGDPNLIVPTSNEAKALYVYDAGLEGSFPDKYVGLNIRPVINPRELGKENDSEKELGNKLTIKTTDSNTEKIFVAYSNGCLKISGETVLYNLSLYDLSGRLVFSCTVDNNICILPALSDGIYFISLSDGENVISNQKVFIK